VYYDTLTVSAVVDELRHKLLDGRVQQVTLIDERTLGFEVYAHHERQYLVASADSQHARVHITQTKVRRGVDTPTPLLLMLRKYVRGARLVAIRQPPFERIVELDLANRDGSYTLIAETMGRHSNVILCGEDGVVMDAVKRVGTRMSRVRPVLPGARYEPPPPQDKLDPTDLTERRLRAILDDTGPGRPAWRALVRGIRGISPLLAREIVYRALGTIDVPAGEVGRMTPLLAAHDELIRPTWEHTWQPCLALQEGQVVAFAPYLLMHYPEHQEVEMISQAIDRYEAAAGAGDPYGSARARVRDLVEAARQRAESRQQALKRQLVPQEELDRLRLSGEMILAYAHAIQRGQDRLEAPYDPQGPPLEIDLDPDLSAVENAQAYFDRYERAKSAAADLPRLLKGANLELAYLDQLATDLELASNRPEIDEVRTALAERGHIPRKTGAGRQRGEPLRVTAADGTLILVGRSARQNNDITFRRAASDDLWLHAVGYPGAHVIVRSGGQKVSEQTLRRAAQLAARYSAGRNEAGVVVAYTERRHVRPIRGAGPGMVTYRHERTVTVSPKGT
jgi:predicted ribosome quality control (RQC) complex YloA/Tae2 family protein